ncbi:ABC transporter G family member 53-like [Impatiens glandulifera]|uniref:ABC transporter G family member 53-like n=1 Tax=Impatiens glandulifera TaxID=253017 RepID=UPI001FB07E20|nr:ABC transporter G family member 53-like [Impatiens glandulifera]
MEFKQQQSRTQPNGEEEDEDNQGQLGKPTTDDETQRVSSDMPTIEVRFKNLNVHAEAYLDTGNLPNVINSFFNFIQGVFQNLHLFPRQRKKLPILCNVNGVIKPGRMTLLLGPPGSGKTTLLLALSGKLRDSYLEK